MAYVNEFFYRPAYEPLDKVHIFLKFLCRSSETVVVIPAVYEIFGGEFYSALFFKVCDKYRVSSLRVAEPLDLFFFAEIIENERKLIEKRGKSYDVRFGIFFAPLFHMLDDILLRIRESGVVCQLFLACPTVRKIIVYLHGVPGHSCQKRHRVFVERFTVFYLHSSFLTAYLPCLYLFAGGSVVHLPQVEIRIIRVEFVG